MALYVSFSLAKHWQRTYIRRFSMKAIGKRVKDHRRDKCCGCVLCSPVSRSYMRFHMYLTESSLEKMTETGRWRFMSTRYTHACLPHELSSMQDCQEKNIVLNLNMSLSLPHILYRDMVNRLQRVVSRVLRTPASSETVDSETYLRTLPMLPFVQGRYPPNNRVIMKIPLDRQ